jgi:hypothetical protein
MPTEIENLIDACFTKDTRGLPDHVYLGSDRKPSYDQFFGVTLGLNREDRKEAEKGQGLKHHESRTFRVRLFLFQADMFQKKKVPIPLKGYSKSSWETMVFQTFLPGWHLIPKKDTYDSLTEADREELLSQAALYVIDLDEDEKPPHTIGLPKKKRTTPAETRKDLIGRALMVLDELLAALPGWDTADENRQRLLADVTFSCYAFFGPQVIHRAVKIAPTLLDHYRYVVDTVKKLERDAGKKLARTAAVVEDVAHATLTLPAPATLNDFYAQLAELVKQAQLDPVATTHAVSIKNYVAEHLGPLILETMIDGNTITDLFTAFTVNIGTHGIDLELDYFQDVSFLRATSLSWVESLYSKLQGDVAPNFLIEESARLGQVAVTYKARLDEAVANLTSLEQRDKEAGERLDKVSFSEHRTLLKQVEGFEEETRKAQRQLRELKDAAVNDLLPMGVVLEALVDDDRKIEPRAESLSRGGVKAVLRYKDHLALKRSTADNARLEGESVVLALGKTPEPERPLGDAAQAIAAPLAPTTSFSQPDAVTPPPAERTPNITESHAVTPVEPATHPAEAQPLPTAERSAALIASTEPNAPEDTSKAKLTGGLSLAHYLNGADAACEHLALCRTTLPAIPAVAADNLALLWVKQGHLPLAARTLEVAVRLVVDGDVLNVSLLQAAYQGMHVWRGDNATVNRILMTLNQLRHEELDAWCDRRPGGKVIPYLVFAAAFQPTVFAGNMTNAPRLLLSVSSYFDGPVSRMIEELVQFTDHNNRLDVNSLRDHPKADEKFARDRIAERLKEWHDRILNKQTGWAPARNAMKNCLARPNFAEVIRAISTDEISTVASVMAFTTTYRDQTEQTRLMHEAVQSVSADANSHTKIAGHAQQWFLRTINEIVHLADDWVEQHTQHNLRSSETSRFARKFSTMADAALDHLRERVARADDFEQRVGLNLVCSVLAACNSVAEGATSPIWNPQRVAGWSAWPAEWLVANADQDDPSAQLDLLLALLREGFDAQTLATQARTKKAYQHANLLTLYRRDVLGEDVTETLQEIEIEFAEEKRICHLNSERVRTMLDNANVASIIDDEQHYQLSAEVEHLQDQIKDLTTIVDLSATRQSLASLESDLREKFAEKIDGLQKELDTLVSRARVEKGVAAVPAAWIDQVNQSLTQNDTTVAEEMLEHLKTSLEDGVPLANKPVKHIDLLPCFLAVEPQLFSALEIQSTRREAYRHLANTCIDGLSFADSSSLFKRGLDDLIALRLHQKSFGKAYYEQIQHVLGSVGLEVANAHYTNQTEQKVAYAAHNKFARLTVSVQRRETGHGVLFFALEGSEQPVDVITASGDWTVKELIELLTVRFTSLRDDRTLVLSGRPISNADRNAFATFCKQGRHTLYLLDPVILAMLAGINTTEASLLETYLHLSLPWTYANPYHTNVLKHAPPEMRYGRQNDIKMLTAMRNGTAIIYGGRQLGKTTLLNEACRVFNNPLRKQHTLLHRTDGNMDRAKLSGGELEKHRDVIWRKIYDAVGDAGLIKDVHGLTTDSMINVLSDYFKKPNAESMLVCLDEIDATLGLDAANGFRIFRELSTLVNNSNDHFKVIIAGLENVRRFADAPNYPLHQLGAALQVSIMGPSEAIQLIREPLAYLGYEFESPLLVNRILVETNRHPGLLHIFCHELICHLSLIHKTAVGSKLITAEEIDNVRKDPRVKDLICNRFEITLALDDRYKLIAYSLIEHGATTFSPARAKEITEHSAPDIFRPMTEAQFEAFLDELCGLGVFHVMRRHEGGKEYALRNANILNLMGGKKNIEDKLIKALYSLADVDPFDGHAFPDKSPRPSPLTLRDEKMLITESIGEKATSNRVDTRSSPYSVGILAGSEATGLNIKWLEETLPLIGEEEPPLPGFLKMRYATVTKADNEFATTADFRKRLQEGVLGAQAAKTPVMVFIHLTGDKPLSHTLDMLDIAHEARLHIKPKTNRVRVLFVMSPKVMWQWESNPVLTRGRDVMQPFVLLDRWKNTALAHLINKLGLESTTASLETLARYSQGWYFSLDHLLQAKLKQPKIERIASFGKSYTHLHEQKPKVLEEFLTKAGIDQVPWCPPLLKVLTDLKDFDEEDFAIQLLELKIEIDPRHAMRWLSRMRLIESVDPKNRKLIYKVNESIAIAVKSRAESDSKP